MPHPTSATFREFVHMIYLYIIYDLARVQTHSTVSTTFPLTKLQCQAKVCHGYMRTLKSGQLSWRNVSTYRIIQIGNCFDGTCHSNLSLGLQQRMSLTNFKSYSQLCTSQQAVVASCTKHIPIECCEVSLFWMSSSMTFHVCAHDTKTTVCVCLLGKAPIYQTRMKSSWR